MKKKKNDQYIKETNTTANKVNNLSNHLDRRRKVFDGTKQDKQKLKYVKIMIILINITYFVDIIFEGRI